MRIPRLGIYVCLAASAFAASPVFTLPGSVIPRKHTVELTIDPSQSTFDGRVEIAVELTRSTTEIWLNAKSLNVAEASVNGKPAKILPSEGEFLGLGLTADEGPGPATVKVRFQGKLDDKLAVGVYRRKVGGDWYAYTTFTPIEGRRAFPCFDEPRFKTPWDISLHVRREQGAFSNGREVASIEEPNGWKLVRFETTSPIPAEVVAFAVGPFEVLDGGIAGAATPIRVIVPKGHSAEGNAAVQGTEMVLPRLEAYTGIPYPFGKLDQIAIPDIEFSAVENPGLITYRAKSLLQPPDADLARARPLRSLQAHEIAHQWFGNLVTQADWREVWLSEGFATWLSAKIMDMEQPAERQHLAAILARERIMQADTSARTRAVRTQVDTREDAGEIYNRFVYDKAGAVLVMLEHWMGEDRFQAGLRGYLNAHRFGSATVDDLSQALRSASGLDPSPVLHAFLDAGGTPSIRGDIECEEGDTFPTPAELRLTQSGTGAVPVCWRTDNGASGCEVIDTPMRAVKIPACPAWVYLNAGGTGYYRTSWTAAKLAQIRLSELTPAERLTLVYDLRGQNTGKGAARAMLERLLKDAEPEIVAAAREGLK